LERLARIPRDERRGQGRREEERRSLARDAGNRWVFPELLDDPDREKSQRVMAAMLKMKKIDIVGLQRAYEGVKT